MQNLPITLLSRYEALNNDSYYYHCYNLQKLHLRERQLRRRSSHQQKWMAGITGTLISSHWVSSAAVICKLCGDHIICPCKSKAGQHSQPHACDALSCLLGNFCYNCLSGFCAEKYGGKNLFALRFVLYYSSLYPNILEPRYYSRSSLPRYPVISAPNSQGWLQSHVWSTASILPYFPPWRTHEEGGATKAN